MMMALVILKDRDTIDWYDKNKNFIVIASLVLKIVTDSVAFVYLILGIRLQIESIN